MKKNLSSARLALLLLTLPVALLRAEEVTIKQSAVLKAERTVLSLKPGTIVELLERSGDVITIKYKDVTGKIPASKLIEPKAEAPKADAPKADTGKSKDEGESARPPQTGYGKAVEKAKDSAKAHDVNVTKPPAQISP